MDSSFSSEATDAPDDRAKRERSKIEFPYSDLEATVDMARVLHLNTGGSPCEDVQLAGWMNQTATGGTFRTRVSSARLFGLIDSNQGRISLTPLGRDIIDTNNMKSAALEAFLRVPLFSAMYEQYKGYALPPPAAIERQMEALGVSSKVKDRARQTFMKSANFAGFIDATTGRFIKPAVMAPAPQDAGSNRLDSDKSGIGVGGNNHGAGNGAGLNLDPLLIELLKKIPQTGDPWPSSQRVRWFRTFAMNVSQIYDDENEPVDLYITSPD